MLTFQTMHYADECDGIESLSRCFAVAIFPPLLLLAYTARTKQIPGCPGRSVPPLGPHSCPASHRLRLGDRPVGGQGPPCPPPLVGRHEGHLSDSSMPHAQSRVLRCRPRRYGTVGCTFHGVSPSLRGRWVGPSALSLSAVRVLF